jgi:hypothetical protein
VTTAGRPAPMATSSVTCTRSRPSRVGWLTEIDLKVADQEFVKWQVVMSPLYAAGRRIFLARSIESTMR